LVALPQVVEWKTQNFGIFLQGRVRFGAYNLIAVQ
jgi:hypothetical protein